MKLARTNIKPFFICVFLTAVFLLGAGQVLATAMTANNGGQVHPLTGCKMCFGCQYGGGFDREGRCICCHPPASSGDGMNR